MTRRHPSSRDAKRPRQIGSLRRTGCPSRVRRSAANSRSCSWKARSRTKPSKSGTERPALNAYQSGPVARRNPQRGRPRRNRGRSERRDLDLQRGVASVDAVGGRLLDDFRHLLTLESVSWGWETNERERFFRVSSGLRPDCQPPCRRAENRWRPK